MNGAMIYDAMFALLEVATSALVAGKTYAEEVFLEVAFPKIG